MKAPKPDKHASRKAIREFLMRLGIVIFMLLGAGIIAYPFVVNALNDVIGKEVLERYQSGENAKFRKNQEKKLKTMSIAEKQRNLALKDPFSKVNLDKADFDSFHPNFYAQHTIAVIYIPKISVGLPVYDNVDERFLARGAAWVPDTSFPSGGEGTHTVITGHRGLPTADLFTDLPKLENGDIFILKQNEKYFAYEVFKKQVVKPEETDILSLTSADDLATLVTCTPYMVNTHRLLVTGKRTPFTPNMLGDIDEIATSRNDKNLQVYVTVSSVAAAAFFVLRSFWTAMQLKRRRYNLRFRVFDELGKSALTGATYQLFSGNGKVPLAKNDEYLLASPNKFGEIVFDSVPGGSYMVKQIVTPTDYQKIPQMKFKMKTISDPFFSADIKKKALDIIHWQQADYDELIIFNPLKK